MAVSSPGRPQAERVAPTRPTAWTQLVLRLHFYIGLFVGPFILVAAITGTLFVLTPQLENIIYAEQLRNDSEGKTQPLSQQVEAAIAHLGTDRKPDVVRPAPNASWNTRVMFTEAGLAGGEHRALFVDPITLDIRGDLVVYGTSGSLPFRTWLDHMHRSLLLGELGRNYSELAASWLWLATLGGLFLWFVARRRTSAEQAQRSARLAQRRLHGLIGIWIAIGLLFLSVTGLTWSNWAGGRIGELRQTLGWVTPSVATRLAAQDEHAHHGGAPATQDEHAHHGGAPATQDEHAQHHGEQAKVPQVQRQTPAAAPDPAFAAALSASVAQLDPVLAATRAAGIDSDQIEIRMPRASDQAWVVRETDRSWPTQVDAIAIDPRTMTVISRADFATFPLVAKLIRWGIDAHMGILFGWVNQLVMAAFGIALSLMVVLGYMMWWKRRPAPGAPVQTVAAAWTRLSWPARVLCLIVAVALGWSLPVMGISLLAFLLIDALRWRLQNTRDAHCTT